MLHYVPEGKNFLADALSWIPLYNSPKAKVVKPLLPSKQLAQVTTQAQAKENRQVDNEVTTTLKATLKDNR